MKIICTLLILCFAFTLNAQENNIRLQFNEQGEFKIIQFTDTHVSILKNQNLDIFEFMQKIIEIEKPDLAILTGDIVTQDDPGKAYQFFVDLFEKEKLPWAVVLGNHDPEYNFTGEKLALLLQKLPLCLNNDEGLTTGDSNFVLPVYGKSKKPKAILYCMDSNAYSTLKPTVEGYGWFDFSQIDWYRQKSSNYTRANGGNPLPALAFFHIPLPEYDLACNNPQLVQIGGKNEKVCCPDINSGMFAAMLECGDVMGTFVGHDHYNDFVINYYNIALAYGRATKSTRQDNPVAGGRIIVLKEGQRQFDTWIRNRNGEKELECHWPASFEKSDK